jgi:putative aldouronate transport system permease protein
MSKRKTRSRDERVFQACTNAFLGLVLVIVILPLWRVFILSVTPFQYVDDSFGLFVSPLKWTVDSYAQFMGNPSFLIAFRNSLVITIGGLAINLLMTVPMAYALSVRTLPGRRLLNAVVLVPYLFNAGLIPAYLVVTAMHMQNTFWAMLIPPAIGIYNMFIMRNFFMEIPMDLKEAARIDGAGELFVLFKIVLPLSLPILLTIGLFYAVGHWNEFFNAILYLNDSKLQPLPVLLRNILMGLNTNEYIEYDAFSQVSTQSLKAASIFITMLPMMMAYPWIQKHFVKGSLAGGIKG